MNWAGNRRNAPFQPKIGALDQYIIAEVVGSRPSAEFAGLGSEHAMNVTPLITAKQRRVKVRTRAQYAEYRYCALGPSF